ncbi:hypothetical protein [Thermocatellispora tengchongensis]|uniref:hypothetical protein n=1 Tax=Thermocatellispora tengchongensis TaxID=1073253 RepID=UPI003641050B
MGRGLAAQALIRLHRRAQLALAFERAGPAEPRVRREQGVLLARGLDDLAEPVGCRRRVTVVEFELRVTQPEFGVDALTRLDAVQQELGGAPEALGQQSRDHGGRRPLPRLDEGDVTV